MPNKISPKGILEHGGKLMDEIYHFHEQKDPGNFYRNHLDLIIATVGGRVNRYILMPYMGGPGISGWNIGTQGYDDNDRDDGGSLFRAFCDVFWPY